MLDRKACYRALESRDARFDGRFFVAVKTTGIYCRPICPARTARVENVRFFPCAAAAEHAGFRPCRRCRPETAPGTPAWLGTSATVSRALRRISDGALDDGTVEALAASVGVSSRQLNRLFGEHLGAGPMAVAQTRRVHFARKLIDETDLPMIQVAFGAGFASVRRFNAAVKKAFDATPSELRAGSRRSGASGAGAELRLRLPYRPPFDWDSLIGFLAHRATLSVESVRPDRYRRTFDVGGGPGLMEVAPLDGIHALELRVRAPEPGAILDIVERSRRLFDLAADPGEIKAHLGRDRRLRAGIRRTPGLRVPGAWDGFEIAVRAILGQQVSVKGATTLAGRIAERFGERIDMDDGGGEEPLTRLFPTPEALADADLTRVGMPGSRARALNALAVSVRDGELDLNAARDLDRARAALCELPGIGPWTADYIAMRALREPDAFPASDLGIRKALARNGALPGVAQVLRAAEKWRPWRAYAAVHLWHLLSAGGG